MSLPGLRLFGSKFRKERHMHVGYKSLAALTCPVAFYSVVKQWVDPVTLEKIKILRGKEEIRQNMELRIPLDQLPPEYGGQSAPLGQSVEEKTLRELITHNNAIAAGDYSCGGVSGGCRFCNFVPARAY